MHVWLRRWFIKHIRKYVFPLAKPGGVPLHNDDADLYNKYGTFGAQEIFLTEVILFLHCSFVLHAVLQKQAVSVRFYAA